MQPDRYNAPPPSRLSIFQFILPTGFPLNRTSSHHTTPILLEPPTFRQHISTIWTAFEIVVDFVCIPLLSSGLAKSLVSRRLRSRHLGLCSDRDFLARAWIEISAPLAYLMRCIASGPMMNRKTIKGITEQLERKGDEMGIWSVVFVLWCRWHEAVSKLSG